MIRSGALEHFKLSGKLIRIPAAVVADHEARTISGTPPPATVSHGPTDYDRVKAFRTAARFERLSHQFP